MTAAQQIDPNERSERLRRRRTTSQIGAGLQLLFHEVVVAPVPADWLELLKRADAFHKEH